MQCVQHTLSLLLLVYLVNATDQTSNFSSHCLLIEMPVGCLRRMFRPGPILDYSKYKIERRKKTTTVYPNTVYRLISRNLLTMLSVFYVRLIKFERFRRFNKQRQR